jgi:hypothetical protein
MSGFIKEAGEVNQTLKSNQRRQVLLMLALLLLVTSLACQLPSIDDLLGDFSQTLENLFKGLLMKF